MHQVDHLLMHIRGRRDPEGSLMDPLELALPVPKDDSEEIPRARQEV